MPKKNMTEAERKAVGERLAAGRAAKQAERIVTSEDNYDVKEVIHPEPQTDNSVTVSNDDLQTLLKRIAELESKQQFAPNPYQPQAPQITSRGLIGTFEKYNVDPTQYPDPCERLAKEPRLSRFAFDINYELDFKVSTTSYTTVDGINSKEPKFDIELYKIVMDEETGDPTTGRYVIRKATFHEDPQAALVVAREQGLNVDEYNEAEFLNEMRYLRMRDWLVEAFYPPKTDATKSNRSERVVGGKLVEFFEKSSVDPTTIQFKS
jgi:hypothetical protein